MQSKALVSIIIVNWNGGKVFLDCLMSLAKVKYPKFELIIIDNGSSDGSQDFLQGDIKKSFKDVSVLKNKENLGFAIANNQGVKEAKGKYILLLNNDVLVTPNFLDILVARMEEESILAVVQPKNLLLDKPGYLDNAGSFPTNIGFFYHWGFGEKDGDEFNKERYIFGAKGACMLIRKDVIDKVGLFDEDFFSYFEETDFCWRALLLGFKVLYCPKSVISHKLGFTIKRLDVLDLNYHYYKNRICSLIKNLSSENLLFILVPHLLVSLGLSVVLIPKNIKSSMLILKAFWWNTKNLGITLAKRSQVQKLRKVSDSELFAGLMQPVDWSYFLHSLSRVEGDIKKGSVS